MADKTRNLGLRASEDLRVFLKELSIKTGKSVQRLFEEAIKYTYQNQEKGITPPSVPPSHLRAHALLETILDSGDQKAIDWISGNLKMFAEALAGRAAAKPPSRKHG